MRRTKPLHPMATSGEIRLRCHMRDYPQMHEAVEVVIGAQRFKGIVSEWSGTGCVRSEAGEHFFTEVDLVILIHPE